MIRADTLDLQNPNSPSAKDHTKQPSHPAPLGIGPAGAHQAQTIRQAEQEALSEQLHGPVGSNPNQQGFYDDDHDDDYDGQNGIHEDDDGEFGDQEGDDGLEDDMMDKISSSPSIDDGKYTLLPIWPTRTASLSQILMSPVSRLSNFSRNTGAYPLPPFTSIPGSLPFPSWLEASKSYHHHEGEYANKGKLYSNAPTGYPLDFTVDNKLTGLLRQQQDRSIESFQHEPRRAQGFLLPVFEPLTEYGMEDPIDETRWDHDNPGLEDEDILQQLNELADFSSDSDSDDDDNDSDSFQFTEESRFIDSGWGGQCLRDTEDIDFEFVYALHTFVATVEGQANATKGDTMLSATMLGDNPEKSKNPLKKAMRRRNAKTVQFAAPTYHEPAEIDYSDEEEGFDEDSEAAEQGEQTGTTQAQDEAATDATSVVEPLKIKSASTTPAPNGIKRVESSDSMADKAEDPEKERTSDEIFDRRDENVARSRNGTVRNTDSFFKDDTAETKKISLTPRLLRGDSDSLDNEQPASKPRPSLEDRLQPDDKSKDEKKKKEKKSGMLSGLFKRKDKKGKAQDIEEGDFEKVSEEIQRASPQPRDSSENLAQEAKATKPEKAPQRHPSKLQKAPPVTVSPKVSPVKEEATKDSSTTSSDVPRSPTKLVPAPLTLRQVTPNDQTPAQQSVSYVKPNETRERPLSPPPQDKTTYASGDGQDRSTLASSPTEPSIHTVEAVEKDDGVTLPASQHPSTSSRIENEVPTTERRTERLSESPVEVTSIEQTEDADYNSTAQPPGLVHDTSSSERPSVSPVSPSMSSVKSDADQGREGDQSTAPTTLSPHADPHSPATTHSNAPSWSDTSLRAYMDNDDEMRDLLVIIHDKSNVVPAGPDHPVTGNLFGAEKGRLAELQSNLDNMLTSWLARKNGSRLPVI
ncbi:putative sh3 domain [Phaeomoniella chlamydospora]|uniref:Putative sh3 domain n=1 Tax=Phaeomoniella chlamydospora TaxID=158046 RepID=A0A0G2EAS3_PHACM|nr:putative sh3 domain [Phaeomoniella chlamydospora]